MLGIATHYGWFLFALLLIGAELLAPGYFMLWIGLAAGAVGLLLLVAPGLPFLAQAIAFLLLSLASCWGYWRFLKPALESSDQPLLNHRAAQFVGQRYVLASAIVNGRGKVAVGDGQWLAEGPDLPAGSEVEVVGVSGASLIVAPPRG